MKFEFKTWKRFKWHLKELDKMYSNTDSFYSKKRIESGIAFLVAQWGMVHWLIIQLSSTECKVSISDICMWAGLEFAICGYVINKIQSEKKENAGQS